MRALEQLQLEELRQQRHVCAARRADLDAEFTTQTCRLQQAYQVWSWRVRVMVSFFLLVLHGSMGPQSDDTGMASLDLVSST
jgi:hypothetical protein